MLGNQCWNIERIAVQDIFGFRYLFVFILTIATFPLILVSTCIYLTDQLLASTVNRNEIFVLISLVQLQAPIQKNFQYVKIAVGRRPQRRCELRTRAEAFLVLTVYLTGA